MRPSSQIRFREQSVKDMKKYIFALVAAQVLAVVPALSQEATAVEPQKFTDTEREQGLISVPYWLRGLHFAAAASPSRPVLLMMVPETWANKTICANATTINGRYLVEGQYVLPGGNGKSMTELKYPTDFKEIWSRSTLQNSGIVLSEGSCETPLTSGTGSNLVPVVFNGLNTLERDTDNRAILVINIHARRTQELLANLHVNDTAIKADCAKIDGADAIQFNFSCRLALPTGATGASSFEVTRLNKGRKAPLLRANIILPDLK